MDFDCLFLRFDHIAMAIFQELDDGTLSRVQRVCRSWYAFLNENQLWRKHWKTELARIVAVKSIKSEYLTNDIIATVEYGTLLDQYKRIKALYDYFTTEDISLSKLRIFVLGLKAALIKRCPNGPNDKLCKVNEFVDPFYHACKLGNIEFIKLVEDCPIDPKLKYGIFNCLIVVNTNTTKHILGNLQKYNINLDYEVE